MKIVTILLIMGILGNGTLYARNPHLIMSRKKLFSHKKHNKAFKKLNISCQACHSFSKKAKDPGPLGKGVSHKMLQAPKDTCHKCHLGSIKMPVRSQCTLCHENVHKLKPRDHFLAWKKRHGPMAQIDGDSCRQCHRRNECSECHVKRDHLNPRVHRGNFRYTHGIQARANPASCIKCHRSRGFCRDCHIGKRGR